jgi:hypothetical protein
VEVEARTKRMIQKKRNEKHLLDQKILRRMGKNEKMVSPEVEIRNLEFGKIIESLIMYEVVPKDKIRSHQSKRKKSSSISSD